MLWETQLILKEINIEIFKKYKSTISFTVRYPAISKTLSPYLFISDSAFLYFYLFFYWQLQLPDIHSKFNNLWAIKFSTDIFFIQHYSHQTRLWCNFLKWKINSSSTVCTYKHLIQRCVLSNLLFDMPC